MDAVIDKGYYSDLKTANKFYQDLADEINMLCDEGKLEDRCGKRVSNTCYFTLKDLICLMPKMGRTIKYQYNLEDVNLIVANPSFVNQSEEYKERLKICEDITGEKIVDMKHYYEGNNFSKIKILNRVKDIYKIVNPYLFYISIFILLTYIILNIKQIKDKYEQLSILMSLVVIYLCRIYIITFTANLMFYEALNVAYMAPIYNIQIIFSTMSIYLLLNEIYNKTKRLNGEKNETVRTNNTNSSIK